MIIVTNLKTKLAALKAWMASKLNDKARVWHKLWSIRLMLITTFYTAAAGAWKTGLIPDDWKPHLSHTTQVILAGIGVVLPGLAAVSVVFKQKMITLPPPSVPPPEVPHGNDPA